MLTPTPTPPTARAVSEALEELAARCETATGADRAIDVAIAVAVDWRWDGWEEGEAYPTQSAAMYGLAWVVERAEISRNSIYTGIPRYTASLDAAMTLIDDNAFFHLSRFSADDGRSEAHVYPNRHVGDDYQSEAATPALALTAAALRSAATLARETEAGS